MWRDYQTWQATNITPYLNTPSYTEKTTELLPQSVVNWSEKSWKKHFSFYLASTDKLVVYPHKSHTTNTTAPAGTHTRERFFAYLTVMSTPKAFDDRYVLPEIDDGICYDAFQEIVPTPSVASLMLNEAQHSTIDLYGQKPTSLLLGKTHCFTTRPSKRVIQRFGLSAIPIELSLFTSYATNGLEISYCRSEDVLTKGPRPRLQVMSALQSVLIPADPYRKLAIGAFLLGGRR